MTGAVHRAGVSDAIVFLEYARYWSQPEDEQAKELVKKLRKTAPDWAALKKAAPGGSRERALVKRYLGQFEQAGQLVRAGALSPDLFVDLWDDAESSWKQAEPWITGLRTDSGRADLYEYFEWLAHRTHVLLDAREKNPPTWAPLETGAPTPEEVHLFFEFASMWQTPRDLEAQLFVEKLAAQAADFASFQRMVPAGSASYTLFDRFYRELDQAGVLVKNGALRTELATLIRSATQWWEIGKTWIVPLREQSKSPHLFENVEWLAKHEAERAAAGKSAGF